MTAMTYVFQAINHYPDQLVPPGRDFARCPMEDCELHTLDQFESVHDLVQHLAREHDILEKYFGNVINDVFVREI
jgi:hypothetical protein